MKIKEMKKYVKYVVRSGDHWKLDLDDIIKLMDEGLIIVDRGEFILSNDPNEIKEILEELELEEDK